MTERGRSLEERLALLGEELAQRRKDRTRSRGAKESRRPSLPVAPKRGSASAFRAAAGQPLAVRVAEADALSGHRGVADGVQVVARLGDVVLACELLVEREGPCLRGQVFGGGADMTGALVHVRTTAGAALACIDAHGEFVAERLPSRRILGLDVETEDGAWSLPWSEEGSP